MTDEQQLCGARTVFWPDDEACDAVCILPYRHVGTIHEDEILGEWNESELSTDVPDEPLIRPAKPRQDGRWEKVAPEPCGTALDPEQYCTRPKGHDGLCRDVTNRTEN